MFCSKCGSEIKEGQAFCPKCGASVNGNVEVINHSGEAQNKPKQDSTVTILAKVFMVIACFAAGWAIIPLLWMVPLTVVYFGKVKRNEPISVAFKVVCLLFVSLLGGICMLCDKDH